MPTHHPDDSLLIEYAAGSVSEARALLVATHMALCPACRAVVRDGEIVGGLLLRDSAYQVGVGDPREPGAQMASARPTDVPSFAPIPMPLRAYLGHPLTDIAWTPVWRGMSEFRLPQFAHGVRLLSIAAGRRMPRHTHNGEELTLVLQGSFADATGHYAKGDVATADPSIDHQPRADASPCLCLVVEDAPLKLTGLLGALATTASWVRETLRVGHQQGLGHAL